MHTLGWGLPWGMGANRLEMVENGGLALQMGSRGPLGAFFTHQGMGKAGVQGKNCKFWGNFGLF